jgi:hypothetical protein
LLAKRPEPFPAARPAPLADSRPRANAALLLLSAVAARGGQVTRELLTAFDWTLAALARLARPPRVGGAVGERPPLQRPAWKGGWLTSRCVQVERGAARGPSPPPLS